MRFLCSDTRRGFSLVELLLGLVLVLLLLGAIVFNFADFGRGADHAEGVRRFEAMLRLARAECAKAGRALRVEFPDGPDAPVVRFELELEPLAAPGEFERFEQASWAARGLRGHVTVERVGDLGELSHRGGAPGRERDDLDGAPLVNGPEFVPEVDGGETGTRGLSGGSQSVSRSVTFRPDGTCDSFEIILVTRGAERLRRTGLRVHGVSGVIERFDAPGDDPSEGSGAKELFR